MSSRIQQLILIAIAILALGCTGCEAIPLSQHPLSDDTNSEIDPALIGMWDIIDIEREQTKQEEAAQADQAKEAEAKDEIRPPRFGVGRLMGKERTLEFVAMEVGEGDVIQVKRMSIHATKVGKQRCLSMRFDAEENVSDYLLLRYDVVNENRILVHWLNREAIVGAIQRGTLKGVVKTAAADPNNPNSEQRKESIRITASPAELREFLAKNEKAAFDAKAVWRLQRAEGK